MQPLSDILHAFAVSRRLTYAAVGLAVLVALVFVAAVLPVERAVAQIEDELLALNRTRALRQTLQQTRAELATFDQTLAGPDELVGVLADLTTAAKRHGLSLPTVSFSPNQRTDSGLEVSAITLELSGGYAGLKALLAEIEAAPRMIVLDALTLSRARDGLKIQAQLGLKLYLRSAP